MMQEQVGHHCLASSLGWPVNPIEHVGCNRFQWPTQRGKPVARGWSDDVLTVEQRHACALPIAAKAPAHAQHEFSIPSPELSHTARPLPGKNGAKRAGHDDVV